MGAWYLLTDVVAAVFDEMTGLGFNPKNDAHETALYRLILRGGRNLYWR